MKIIVAIDGGSNEEHNKIKECLEEVPSLFVKTDGEKESREVRHLRGAIECFSHSLQEVMIIRFSGRKSVIEEIGGETAEMLVHLSYNKNSPSYAENPTDILFNETNGLINKILIEENNN